MHLDKEFKPPAFLFNKHFETIYPALFRRVAYDADETVRIDTPDQDFLDLDLNIGRINKTVIICHGLEGDSRKAYIRGMARQFHRSGFNCIAWNYRGCSGEMNNQVYSYHSGATGDLDLVVNFAIEKFDDCEIYLVGFSLGGNLVLKYLGENGYSNRKKIKKAAAISVPLDLYRSCLELSKNENWIYTKRFLNRLTKKVKHKSEKYPGQIALNNVNAVKTLLDFDDHFTAPIHGFKNAKDYYQQCSSIFFLKEIAVPTLILNARNDHFLSKECFPSPKEINNRMITTVYTSHGGHVGFKMIRPKKGYFSEILVHDFFHDEVSLNPLQ